MKSNLSVSRRGMMKILAASSAPLFLPRRLFGEDAPSKKITVALIGLGMQGGGTNINQFLACGDCRVVAICDLDPVPREANVKKVNGHYKNSDCAAYKDYREVMARADIDAVVISVPDHWHSVIAIAAANAKKDIFCEKPLSKTLNEGIAMVAATQKNGRVWQTGSWQRSQNFFRWGATLVQNGYIGKVSRVEVGLPSGHNDFGKTGNDKPNGEPPPGVDFDYWTGPSELMPFNPCRFHKNWRWNYNVGGGQLMDWIGHHCDIAHWGLANPKFGCGPDDAVGPSEVKATADFPAHENVWNTATKFRVECKYPNDVEVVIAGGHNDIQGGTRWIGADGWVQVNRGKFETSNKAWMDEMKQKDKDQTLAINLYKSPGHGQEFIDCVKSRKRTLTPVEIAHRSQTPGHLGYIAAKVGRTLKWDAVKQEIAGDPEATKLLGRAFRAPWKI